MVNASSPASLSSSSESSSSSYSAEAGAPLGGAAPTATTTEQALRRQPSSSTTPPTNLKSAMATTRKSSTNSDDDLVVNGIGMMSYESGIETLAEEADNNNADTSSPGGNGNGNSEWRKYRNYSICVDPKQDDRATEICLCSWERPHMRAFHCSWFCFFISFFIWFAIGPLLPMIRDDLNLTNQELWTSSILGVGGTVLCRFILGPLCDKYGARILFSIIMIAASIPTACIGFIQTSNDLMIIRLCIGIAGGTFVMCEYWTSIMFTKEVVGTANAIVAGWGNLGAGVTQIVMGSLLFPLFRWLMNGNSTQAWRTVCIVPAIIGFLTGIVVYFISDDCPKGNYHELEIQNVRKPVSSWTSWKSGSMNWTTWILAIQYGCCFGVELTMNNATALYFESEFGQSSSTAGAIASIFGWMNLFARGVGGFYSDYANLKYGGMYGRLWIHVIFLVGEGIFVLIFAHTQTLVAAIGCLILFSLFVQASEGASYGIVPYVNPQYTGTVSGIVGAGGNIGAVGFGLCFRQMSSYRYAFITMGITILVSSLLTIFIRIDGQSTLFNSSSATVVVPSSSSKGSDIHNINNKTQNDEDDEEDEENDLKSFERRTKALGDNNEEDENESPIKEIGF